MDLISPQFVLWAGWVSIVVLAVGVFVRAAWPMLDRNGLRSVKRGRHVRQTFRRLNDQGQARGIDLAETSPPLC